MALSDTLRERVSRRGRTAQVDCGALGTLTVEALSPRECAALGTADGGRAILYAACRELQAAGETLRRERRLYTPDEITQYLSDSEAAAAARVVLELSGVSEFHESRLPFVQEKGASGGAFGSSPSSGSGQLDGNNLSNLDEIRLSSVQQAEGSGTENREIRLRSVQSGGGANGQNSRETVQNSDAPAGADAPGDRLALPVDGAPAGGEKAQTLGYLSEKRTQNVGGLPENGQNRPTAGAPAESPLHEMKSEFGDGLHEVKSEFRSGGTGALHEMESDFRRGGAEALHETESEFGSGLHEIESEFRPGRAKALHETESESGDGLHESKSEFRSGRAKALHETESESGDGLHESKSDFRSGRAKALHETESEFGGGLHESKSDFRSGEGENLHESKSEFRDGLHETTSELAEQVAQRLLEGLRRAAVAQTGGFS